MNAEQCEPRECGIARNFSIDLPISPVLEAQRCFALGQLERVDRIEVDLLNFANGFICVEAFGPVSDEEAAALDEIFGLMFD